MSGKLLKGYASQSMVEFSFIKHLNVPIHAPKAPCIIQIIWQKPPCGWVKCNTNGASRGNLGLATCGGIFRDSSGVIMGCFSDFLGTLTSFQAELVAIMLAIERLHLIKSG